MYTNNELMFPPYVIPSLKKLRGPEWEALVDQVTPLSEYHDEAIAFMLMMVRLNGCVGCETDSFRAMRGCAACAQQTLRRFKGSDADLIGFYQQALADVRKFAGTHPRIGIQSDERLSVEAS